MPSTLLERLPRLVRGWLGANIIASQSGMGKVLRYLKKVSILISPVFNAEMQRCREI
jgi:hypothetical protein